MIASRLGSLWASEVSIAPGKGTWDFKGRAEPTYQVLKESRVENDSRKTSVPLLRGLLTPCRPATVAPATHGDQLDEISSLFSSQPRCLPTWGGDVAGPAHPSTPNLALEPRPVCNLQ